MENSRARTQIGEKDDDGGRRMRKTATKSDAKKDTLTHTPRQASRTAKKKNENTFITVVSFLFEIYYICNFSMLMHTNVVWLLHLFIRFVLCRSHTPPDMHGLWSGCAPLRFEYICMRNFCPKE